MFAVWHTPCVSHVFILEEAKAQHQISVYYKDCTFKKTKELAVGQSRYLISPLFFCKGKEAMAKKSGELQYKRQRQGHPHSVSHFF